MSEFDFTPPERPKPPSRGRGIALFLVGLLGGGAATYGALRAGVIPGVHGEHDAQGGAASAGSPSKSPKYHCPMHPTYTSDRASDPCPICGMKLVPIDADHAADADADHALPSAASPSAAELAEPWQCPKHPTYTAEKPGECIIDGETLVPVPGMAGKPGGPRRIVGYRHPHEPTRTSPVPMKDEMGMDYVPIYEEAAAGGGTSEVAGMAAVKIDPQRQQLIGLRTALVVSGPVGRTWRTTGKVAIDETRVKKVNVKVEGFVEKLHVDYVGRPVRKGEALLELYSPELVSAQNEFLLALRTEKALAASALGDGGDGGDGGGLVDAARQKLRLWDIPRSVLGNLERSGRVQKTLTIASPIAGVVTQKAVVEGSRLLPGDTPFEITDLSRVWVLADVYATEVGQVRKGAKATLTLQGQPERAFEGEVGFIDPLVDEKTRTVRVRLAFPNDDGELRPGAFGEVVFRATDREGLLIPADAVIDSGTQKVVFVAKGQGRFEPREVRTAAAPGDQVEVTAGLQAGEAVVTRANFLVDSESRLKAALSAMTGGK